MTNKKETNHEFKLALYYFNLKENYTYQQLEECYQNIQNTNFSKGRKEMLKHYYQILKNDYYSRLYSKVSRLRNKILNYQEKYIKDKKITKLCSKYLPKLKKISRMEEFDKLNIEFEKAINKLLKYYPKPILKSSLLEQEIQSFSNILKEDSKANDLNISKLAIYYKALILKVKNKEDLYNLEHEYRKRIIEINQKKFNDALTNIANKYPNDSKVLAIVSKYENLASNPVFKNKIPDLYIRLLSDIKTIEAEYEKTTTLETKKKEFFKQLISIEKNESNNSNILNKIQEYKEILPSINELSNLKYLIASFKKEYLLLKDDNKRKIDPNIDIKNDLKKHFSYLCTLYKFDKGKDSFLVREAEEFLEELKFLIDETEPDEIDKWVECANRIKFINLEEDKKVLKELNTYLPIYINKYDSEVVLLKKKAEEVKYYSLNTKSNKTLNQNIFEKTFISLKNFFKKATYVGNKKARLLDMNGEEIRTSLTFEDYLWYYDGLMLALEDNYDEKRFTFYPLARYAKKGNPVWKISPYINKKEPSDGIYQNPDYTYQILEEYYRNQLEDEITKKSERKY